MKDDDFKLTKKAIFCLILFGLEFLFVLFLWVVSICPF